MSALRESLSLPTAEPAADYGFFARVLRSVPPANPVTMTPREGRPPSDEGIVESEPILGTVG